MLSTTKISKIMGMIFTEAENYIEIRLLISHFISQGNSLKNDISKKMKMSCIFQKQRILFFFASVSSSIDVIWKRQKTVFFVGGGGGGEF